ncbi:hypothetical protein ACRE_050710 [Hapsidospora chrysogenum ATCC 11550]|uniref:Uncharacterized protein n=1 Tax=Hapsidospora chrysogenum (strain ATCC 11550 / CBS 779.69 / DSM 880 / IAM 14645 / JCM 23072 / IMI 49137) TaxID=857340 RepID=A0A086T464_HAPC1|nr:hypothetical protein ACRE_050710 [Hapsidospora chrysogenum ATCC 11550]
MLVKILNLDEQNVRPAAHGGYFFRPTVTKRYILLARPVETWTEDDSAAVQESVQESFDRFQDHLAAAENEGQRVFVKEHAFFLNNPLYEWQHAYGVDRFRGQEPLSVSVRGLDAPPNASTRSPLNLTSMPDEFLLTWNPTFLIRHPAMVLPSLYRVTLKDVEIDGFQRPERKPMAPERTMKWVRSLYDFYAAHFGDGSPWPIVLDADDVITQPALVARYAALVGLDPDKLRFSWDKMATEKLSPVEKLMLSTISTSTGVDVSKAAGDIDIGREAVRWREEFGAEAAGELERWVSEAMPDYLFLRERRLKLE